MTETPIELPVVPKLAAVASSAAGDARSVYIEQLRKEAAGVCSLSLKRRREGACACVPPLSPPLTVLLPQVFPQVPDLRVHYDFSYDIELPVSQARLRHSVLSELRSSPGRAAADATSHPLHHRPTLKYLPC